MKKLVALTTLACLVVLTLPVSSVNADNWFGNRLKRHERNLQKAADILLPDLVVVDVGNHRHGYYGRDHDRDLIFYPKGDYKGRDRCEVVVDQYNRPWCRKHHHYGNWRYEDLSFWHSYRDHGGCFVGWYDNGWWCYAHRSHRCQILTLPPYVRGGQFYFQPDSFEIVEESHRIWEQGAGTARLPQDEPPTQWDYDPPAGPRQLLVGPHGAKQLDGTEPWCFHHYSSRCVIIEGPLNGKPLQLKGQMLGEDGNLHSYYCPVGGNCRL